MPGDEHDLRGLGARQLPNVRGQLVFQVAAVTREGDDLGLVGVLDRDPQPPLLDLQLFATQHVELDRLDAEPPRLIARLLAPVGMLAYELYVALAVALEIPQHIFHVALHNLDLGRQLSRHEERDRHDVVEVAQHLARPLGYRVQSFRRKVDAPRHVAAEHVRRYRDADYGRRAEPQIPVQLRLPVQALSHQHPVGQRQERDGERDEVDHVAKVEHPTGHVVKVGQYP